MGEKYCDSGDFLKMEEINIYHRPGPFIYTVRDANGVPLYVGGTENINAKSFKFDFEFTAITGYYYDFPDFEDEIDREIVLNNPVHNQRLRSSFTAGQIVAYVRNIFREHGAAFRKAEKKYVLEYLADCDSLVYRSEVYYSRLDRDVLTQIMLEQWNIQ